MQIWRISVTDGALEAVHGMSYLIYEGYVPDLKLTINKVTTFVNEDDSKRYENRNDEEKEECLLDQPDPELICEIELSRSQIEDAKALTDQDGPYERLTKLIASTLENNKLDTDGYEE